MDIKAQFSRMWATEFGPGIAPELAELNRAIEHLSAGQRVERALELLPGEPVVLLDTGYLFPETYCFIDELTERLKLNLKVFRAESSPAWQETRFGKLWDQGLSGIERYNRINKQEPLDRALNELHATTWFAGLRRAQAKTRSRILPIEFRRGRYKVHP